MNRVFDTGKYGAITCYRNSKNFANQLDLGGLLACGSCGRPGSSTTPRMLLGTNCASVGHRLSDLPPDVIRRNTAAGPIHLLTEDIEFSVVNALKGERIGYCGAADGLR